MRAAFAVPMSALLFAVALPVPAASAQSTIDLTVNDVGLAVGDSPRTIGLRLNYVDRRLERVTGLNVAMGGTRSQGNVVGIALGAPATQARTLSGIGLGGWIGAGDRISGVTIAALGVDATTRVRWRDTLGGTRGGRVTTTVRATGIDGVAIGGLRVSTAGRIRGITAGGLGVRGRRVYGIQAAGLLVQGDSALSGISLAGLAVTTARQRGIALVGAGVAGGRMEGIHLAGLFVSGSHARGVNVAGGFVHGGSSLSGINIGGISASGRQLRGINASGFRVSGDSLAGVSIAGGFVNGASSLRGAGIGGVVLSDRITGLAVGGAVGGSHLSGAFVSPLGVSVARDGELRGLTVSSFNAIHGTQRGVSIGVINSARELHGVQLGVINVAKNNPRGRRVLPLVNWHRD